MQCGVIKKSGSWFTYEGDQLGQGRENVRKFLKDNPAITEEISDKVKAAFGLMRPEDQFAENEDNDSVDNTDKSESLASKTEKSSKASSKSSKSSKSSNSESSEESDSFLEAGEEDSFEE